MTRRTLAAGGLVIVGVGAFAAAIVGPSLFSSGPTIQYLTAAARVTDVVDSIATTGSIAATSYSFSFGSAPTISTTASASSSGSSAASGGGSSAGSWLVASVDVSTGQAVTAGQVLATADPSSAELSVLVAKASLTAAEARLAADQGKLSANDLAAATLALTQARNSVANAQASASQTSASNALKLRQAEDAVTQAKANLASAQLGATGDSLTSANDALAAAKLAHEAALKTIADTQAANQLKLQQALQAWSDASTALERCRESSAGSGGCPTQLAASMNAESAYETVSSQVSASNNQLASQQAQAELAWTTAQHQYDARVKPSQTSVDAATQAVTSAEANLAALKLQLAQSETQNSQQITAANLNLQSATLSYTTKTTPNATAVASDEAAVAQARQTLANAELTLTYATLTSPIDGVVTAVNVTPGFLASGTAVVVRSTALQVKATVAETNLPNLRLGQEATVTITALGASVTGTVASIDQTGSSSGTGGVVSYGVVIALPSSAAGSLGTGSAGSSGGTITDPLAAAHPGMSTQVAVIVAQAKNVLAVPATAVRTADDGTYYVSVLDEKGQPRAVAVEIGLVTSSDAQITSGIAEGTIVVTGTASTRTSTGTSSSTNRNFGGGGFSGLDVGGGPPPNVQRPGGSGSPGGQTNTQQQP